MDIKKDIAEITTSALKDYPNKVNIILWEKKDLTEYCIVVLYNESTYSYALDVWGLLIPSIKSSKHCNTVSVGLEHEKDAEKWIVRY